ncbi:unnamed protein product [Chrysodeixis includens]|uniref:Uncharacterized protein n=1 Tax=Chrysodeixis includens TaxID=689277 RepID=A0A9P0C0Q3_CHRIL|nr:unnamed protein product [Chrysodeixis includens]
MKLVLIKYSNITNSTKLGRVSCFLLTIYIIILFTIKVHKSAVTTVGTNVFASIRPTRKLDPVWTLTRTKSKSIYLYDFLFPFDYPLAQNRDVDSFYSLWNLRGNLFGLVVFIRSLNSGNTASVKYVCRRNC